MVIVLIHAFYCGLAGYLIGDILTMHGEVFGFARPLFFKLTRVRDEFELGGFSYFLYKISIGCSKCIAGQLALWSIPLIMEGLNMWWWAYGLITAIFLPVLISKMFN